MEEGKGCSFGRGLKYRVKRVEEKLEGLEEKTATEEERVREIEKTIAYESGKYIVIGAIISAIIASLL